VRYGTKARSPGEDLREVLPEYSSSSFLAFAGSKEEDKKPRPKEIQEYHSILFKPNIDTKKSNTTSRYFFCKHAKAVWQYWLRKHFLSV